MKSQRGCYNADADKLSRLLPSSPTEPKEPDDIRAFETEPGTDD